VQVAAIALLAAAVVLLIAPGPFHRIVERGHDTARQHRFTLRMVEAALGPFALAMAIDFAVAARRMYGARAGIAGGALAAVTALGAWYGAGLIARARAGGGEMEDEGKEEASLHTRIRQVLTEARVVLPG